MALLEKKGEAFVKEEHNSHQDEDPDPGPDPLLNVNLDTDQDQENLYQKYGDPKLDENKVMLKHYNISSDPDDDQDDLDQRSDHDQDQNQNLNQNEVSTDTNASATDRYQNANKNCSYCLLCGSCDDSFYRIETENQVKWTEDFFKLFNMTSTSNVSANIDYRTYRKLEKETEEIRNTIQNSFYCIDCLGDFRRITEFYKAIEGINSQLRVIQIQCESKLKICIESLSQGQDPEEVTKRRPLWNRMQIREENENESDVLERGRDEASSDQDDDDDDDDDGDDDEDEDRYEPQPNINSSILSLRLTEPDSEENEETNAFFQNIRNIQNRSQDKNSKIKNRNKSQTETESGTNTLTDVDISMDIEGKIKMDLKPKKEEKSNPISIPFPTKATSISLKKSRPNLKQENDETNMILQNLHEEYYAQNENGKGIKSKLAKVKDLVDVEIDNKGKMKIIRKARPKEQIKFKSVLKPKSKPMQILKKKSASLRKSQSDENYASLKSKYKLKDLSVKVDRISTTRISRTLRSSVRNKTQFKKYDQSDSDSNSVIQVESDSELESDSEKKFVTGTITRTGSSQQVDNQRKRRREIRNRKLGKHQSQNRNQTDDININVNDNRSIENENASGKPKRKRRKKCEMPPKIHTVALPKIPCTHAPECNRHFRSEITRDEHLIIMHGGKKFECTHCPIKYAEYRQFIQHQNVHLGLNPFKCSYPGCTEEFPMEHKLRYHQRKHNIDPMLSTFPCDLCNKILSSAKSLKEHLERFKNDPEHNQSSSSVAFIGDTGKPRQYVRRSSANLSVYKCPIENCEKTYSILSNLKMHQKTHDTNYKNIITCSYCQKIFQNKHILKRHVQRLHTKAYDFRCHSCPFGTTNKCALDQHIESIHNGERNLKCEVCSHTFKHRYHLSQHVQRYHPVSKDFMCSICGKCFSNKRYLQEHDETHKEIKSNLCSECGKGFTQRTSLNKHMKTVHNLDKLNNLSSGSSSVLGAGLKKGEEQQQQAVDLDMNFVTDAASGSGSGSFQGSDEIHRQRDRHRHRQFDPPSEGGQEGIDQGLDLEFPFQFPQ